MELDDRIRQIKREKRIAGLPTSGLSIACTKEEIETLNEKYAFNIDIAFGTELMGFKLVQRT